MNHRIPLLLVFGFVLQFSPWAAAAPKVTAVRCPNGGLQPDVAVDAEGVVHAIYLKGEEGACDVFYVTSKDAGQTWSNPLRVNSQPGAAIMVGTVRGAHLALGRGGRPHVAWMGSRDAQPKGPNDGIPMLYARMNDAGDGFEPQRNVMTQASGLDGGGSVAADGAGNVYVAWHAPIPGTKGEENRTVWVAASKDDGRTFASETRMFDQSTGTCGCCGMRVGVDAKGNLLAVYRAANPVTRDIYLAEPNAKPVKVEEWAVKTCPMSTAAFARAGERELAAWEAGGQVSFAAVDGKGRPGEAVAAPGKGNNRKHPSLAVNKDGMVLLAWTEGTGWKKGGTVMWQVYDPTLKAVREARGTQAGMAAWSKPAAFAAPDGSFVVMY